MISAGITTPLFIFVSEAGEEANSRCLIELQIRSEIFQNCCYYWLFAAFVSYFINHPLYTPPAFGFPQVMIGLVGFVICEFGVPFFVILVCYFLLIYY